MQTNFAHTNMLLNQMQPCGIRDDVLDCLRGIERAAFLPEALKAEAYCDKRLFIKKDRQLLTPTEEATIIQTLHTHVDGPITIASAMNGYIANCLATLGHEVLVWEPDEALHDCLGKHQHVKPTDQAHCQKQAKNLFVYGALFAANQAKWQAEGHQLLIVGTPTLQSAILSHANGKEHLFETTIALMPDQDQPSPFSF